MNSIIKEINLNVGQPNNYQLIHAMQGDNDTITIVAHLFNINKPYVIQESVDTILFSATTPTKSYIAKNIEKYDDSSVKFELDKNMLAINGEVVFSIILMDSNTKQSLSTFPSIIHVTNAPDGEIQETDISAITDYVFKAKEYYEKLISEKGKANGIAVLDENTKVPLSELYDATTESKGVVQLTDSVSSNSTTTAATPNSVKAVNDALTAEINRATNAEKTLTDNLNSEISRAKSAESTITTNLNNEVTRAKASEKNNADAISAETTRATGAESTLTSNLNAEITRSKKAEQTNADNISAEITRAKAAESDLDSKKVDKTTVAGAKVLGLVKSGTDITVDTSGNVSVNDNSHKHTVSNISDLTATASELNVLDGITATTTELNYTDGVTSNIQTQLNAKAPLASPTLTGTPKAPTASAGTNTTQIATTAFVQTAVGNGIAASDAMIIKGTIGTSGTVTALPTTYKTGWTYRVVTNGTYAGQVCEIGDLIVALVDRNGSGNVDTDWCVAQTNINGAITGIKSGDAYIAVSQSGSVVTITHKDVSRSNTTSTVSPTHGGTFTAVKTVTSDSKGHITGVDTETVTLPTYTALKNPNAISLNGKSYDGSSAVDIGTIGVAYGGTGQTTANAAANSFINSLSIGDSTPTDADYYVSQYVGGGTTTTSYHRRPMSALWNYIKSKLATVATSGSYNDLSNKPTIPSVGNGTITITQNGTSKGTFTTNQSGNTTIALNNTTYSDATTSASGLMSSSDKTKLNGVATGAEVNQNAFSNVTVGSTTVSADSKTDTLTLVAGSNVTITPDATNDKITISSKDTVYTHPDTPGNKHIPSGGSSGQILKWTANGTAAWGDAGDAETMVTGVKGSEESEYRKGLVNITKENIGLDKVDNTADKDKSVKYATSSGSATKATQDGNGNVIATTYALQSVVSKKAGKASVNFNYSKSSITVPNDPCIVGVITGVTGASPKCDLYYYTSKTGTLIEVVKNSGYKPLVSGTTVTMGGTTGVLFAIG